MVRLMPTTGTVASAFDATVVTVSVSCWRSRRMVNRIASPTLCLLIAARTSSVVLTTLLSTRRMKSPRLQLAFGGTAVGHPHHHRVLDHLLPGRPKSGGHRRRLGVVHHLHLLCADLVDARAGRVDGVAGQHLPSRQPVGQQRLRKRQLAVGAGHRHRSEPQLPCGREGLHTLDVDRRHAVHRLVQVDRGARRPAHEGHGHQGDDRSEGHEQQRRDGGRPGLLRHPAETT